MKKLVWFSRVLKVCDLLDFVTVIAALHLISLNDVVAMSRQSDKFYYLSLLLSTVITLFICERKCDSFFLLSNTCFFATEKAPEIKPLKDIVYVNMLHAQR